MNKCHSKMCISAVTLLSPRICVSHYRKVTEEFHLTSLPIFRAQHYTWHTADPQ